VCVSGEAGSSPSSTDTPEPRLPASQFPATASAAASAIPGGYVAHPRSALTRVCLRTS
jgi:hypothetical protein